MVGSTAVPSNLCAGLLLAGLVGCGAPSEGELSALTYNVAGLPAGISRSSPEQNIPRISVRLNRYDLVLVQEDFSYHHLLRAAAEHPYRSPPLEDFETLVGDGLNRFSRFPLGPMERERWPACSGAVDGASDCLAAKGWSFSEVELDEQVVLHVYNHHAEAGGGPGDVAARAEGFLRLSEVIRARSEGHAVLVGGDTNLHADDVEDAPVYDAFLADTGLTDLCRALECGDERIDRFAFRSGPGLALEPLEWGIAEEMVDDEGAPLSDHLAVRARLAWSEDR